MRKKGLPGITKDQMVEVDRIMMIDLSIPVIVKPKLVVAMIRNLQFSPSIAFDKVQLYSLSVFNEPISKHKNYQGKRIKRELFRSASGILINADVNTTFNILRKVFPNAFTSSSSSYLAKEIVGTVHYPECYNL